MNTDFSRPVQTEQLTYRMPVGACDTHCHIFGPVGQFPFSAQRTYTPPEHTEADLASLHESLRITRCVLVQPAAHGFDNSALLSAIALRPEHRRGIVLAQPGLTPQHLRALHSQGVRGVRFNFIARLGGLPGPDFFLQTARLAEDAGWHIVLHVGPQELLSAETMVEHITVPFVIDHMARLDINKGLEQPAMQVLERLLNRPNCWVKISGADRLCASPFHEALPLMQRLAMLAPDRTLWGTDAPHPNAAFAPDDKALINLIPLALPDAALRQQVLVENPARLYGFAS